MILDETCAVAGTFLRLAEQHQLDDTFAQGVAKRFRLLPR
jgi:hypothetical protein